MESIDRDIDNYSLNDELNNTSKSLLSNESEIIKLKSAIVMIPYSISSKYSSQYSLELRDIITPDELHYVIDKLNDSIQSNMPCIPMQIVAYSCCICTLGISLLLPKLCLIDAESNANKILEQISLTSKFYDRKISFQLERHMLTSNITIRFPKHLKQNVNTENEVDELNSYESPSRKKGT